VVANYVIENYNDMLHNAQTFHHVSDLAQELLALQSLGHN
jgi:hypothetical protein